MRIGFHFPFSGGLKTLKKRIKKSRGNTFQIFARGLRGGDLRELKEKDLKDLFEFLKLKNIKPNIIHAPYIYNLANLELYDEEKVLEDLDYAIELKSPYYVIQPGRYKDMHPLTALENVKIQLWDIMNKTEWMGQILVRNTGGSGTEIGYDLREWKELITYHNSIKGALDLAKLYTAGYDFKTKITAQKLYDNIEEYIGWDNIKVIYINDTDRTIGSRKKEPTPPALGEGVIGFSGYREILKFPKVQEKIWIIENTPDDTIYPRTLNFLLSLRR
jgi:deoxyribonuclease-4